MRQEVVNDQKFGEGESLGQDKEAGKVNGTEGYGPSPGSSAPAPIISAAPINSAGGGEDQKETAKHRLQKLIRDFAHDAVGVGISVEAACSDLAENDKLLSATLRMDRRLSQAEIWRPAGTDDAASSALLVIKLQDVESIVKGLVPGSTDSPQKELDSTTKGDSALKMVRRTKTPVTLTFESSVLRDRAYTCLRIFQMSVDQVGSGSGSPRSPNASPRAG